MGYCQSFDLTYNLSLAQIFEEQANACFQVEAADRLSTLPRDQGSFCFQGKSIVARKS
jgi:hypothetical protein